MEPCVEVSDLRKSYGPVRAVDGVSFDVEYGKVFGFLGPNGAGKTTAIRVLTTLVHPTSGSVRIFGKDIVKHHREIKKRIGVVLQEPSYEANLTVEQALELYGLMWGVPGEKRRDRARELIEKFDLTSFKGMKNDELSIGQRRRVQVAREFMHDMDLLFLDEPTMGLDPAARDERGCGEGRADAALDTWLVARIAQSANWTPPQRRLAPGSPRWTPWPWRRRPMRSAPSGRRAITRAPRTGWASACSTTSRARPRPRAASGSRVCSSWTGTCIMETAPRESSTGGETSWYARCIRSTGIPVTGPPRIPGREREQGSR